MSERALKKYSNILLIGGATRNVGKTTFTCSVIDNLSQNHKLIALKIKTVYEGDDFFHGKDRNPLTGKYRIIEEKNSKGIEDTERMLSAGAERVFRIKAKNQYLKEAFDDFYNQIQPDNFIICESNSLRNIIIPELFLLIKLKNSLDIKPSAAKLEHLADKIIYSKGDLHDFDAENISIENNRWILKKN